MNNETEILQKLLDRVDVLEAKVKRLEDRNKPFKKPSKEEVAGYFNQIITKKNGLNSDTKLIVKEINNFYRFYDEIKDWRVGKNKMKSWEAAIRNWCKDKNFAKNDTSNEIRKGIAAAFGSV